MNQEEPEILNIDTQEKLKKAYERLGLDEEAQAFDYLNDEPPINHHSDTEAKPSKIPLDLKITYTPPGVY